MPQVDRMYVWMDVCAQKTTLAASWASSIRTLMGKDLVQKTAGTVYALTATGENNCWCASFATHLRACVRVFTCRFWMFSGSVAAERAHEAYQACVREAPQETTPRPPQLGVRR